MKVRVGFTSSIFGDALPTSNTILYVRLGSGISCALGKSMAESTLGIGRVCGDCACVDPGSAINRVSTATGPIHIVFIRLSINRGFGLAREESWLFYIFQSGLNEFFSRLRREFTILPPLRRLYSSSPP